jgi:hypothetical protein
VGRRGGGLREDKCPWYRPPGGDNPNLDVESQQKTRNIIQYLQDDVGTTLQWAKSTSGCPKHFPDSEWTNIIRGRLVDLGKVLASQYILHAVPESIGSLGGIEIRFPGKRKTRKIENVSNWFLAWQSTTEATAFAFLHRQKELTEYSAYIVQKFKRRNPIYQGQAILFDKAIRGTVRGGENSSLLDANIHAEFDKAILHPNGAKYQSGGGCRTQKGQLCNRFNRRFGCDNASCAYKHKCRACKETEHRQSTCPKNQSDGKGNKAKIPML